MQAGGGGLQPPPNSGDWPLLLAKAGVTSPAPHLPSAGTWSGNVLTWETGRRAGGQRGCGNPGGGSRILPTPLLPWAPTLESPLGRG